MGSALVGLTAVLAVALWLTASQERAVWWILVWGMPVLGSATMGLVLRLRVPQNPIGWLFLVIGFAEGLGIVCEAYAARAPQLPGGLASAVVANVLEPLPLFLLPGLLLLFPEGHVASPRWRRFEMVWAVLVAALVLGIVVGPGAMSGYANTLPENPLAISGSNIVGSAIGFFAFVLLIVVIVIASGALVVRFRRATGDLRQQLKWFGAAAAFLAAVIGSGPLGLWTPWNGDLWTALWAFGMTALVAATGIAILRYRLYEIDVIIRRTLVYTALVGSLTIVYLGGIYLIDRALQAVTGQSGAFAVTLSTLTVAGMFQPLRTRIRHGVDHRFYRGKYDAARALDAFTSRLRDQIDLNALHTEVLDVVNATLQPRHASLWIRPIEPASPNSAGEPRPHV